MSFELSIAETAVARCSIDAACCDFGKGDGSQPAVVIRAEAIRRLLMGLPLRLHGETQEQRVPVAGAGVIVRAAIISGILNLEDARSPDGESCPSLTLLDCVIAERMHLAGARLRALSLKGCKITHLCAPSLRLDGRLDLRNLHSAERPKHGTGAKDLGLCWVDMQGAVVEGSVEACGSAFVAPVKRDVFDTLSTKRRYALDLREAVVSRNLELEKDGISSSYIGGLCLVGAVIRGDCWAAGVELVGIEGVAFSGRGLVVQHSLNLSAASRDGTIRRTVATGDVDILGAKIGRTVYLCGARIDGRVVVVDTQIGGSVAMTPYHGRDGGKEESLPFAATGHVLFYDAKIGGSVELASAQLEGRFVAVGVTIGANLTCSASDCMTGDQMRTVPFCVKEAVWLDGTQIGGMLDMRGAVVGESISMDFGAIGGDVSFAPWLGTVDGKDESFPFIAKNDIYLYGTRICGDLNAQGARFEGGFYAGGVSIGGFAVLSACVGKVAGHQELLRFGVARDVDLRRVKISGSLLMHGAELKDLLSATGIEVGGSVILETWQGKVGDREVTLPFTTKGSLWFYGAAIGGNIEACGAVFEDTFVATGATIGGSVLFNARDPRLAGQGDSVPFVADGYITFYGASIRGNLELCGAVLGDELSADGADIGGAALLRAWDGEKDGKAHSLIFSAKGDIRFFGTNVRRAVELDGAHLEGGFTAEGGKIGGAFLMRAWDGKVEGRDESLPFVAKGPIRLYATEIDGNVSFGGAQLESSFTAEGAVIGGSAQLRSQVAMVGGRKTCMVFSVKEDVRFYDTKIKHSLDLGGAVIAGDLNVTNLETGGDVTVGSYYARLDDGYEMYPFAADGVVRFSGAHIGGNIDIFEAKLSNNVYMNNATIGGTLDIRLLEPEGKPESDPQAIPEFNLSGTKVGELADYNGQGFGDRYRLRLDGFQYERVRAVDDGALGGRLTKLGAAWRKLKRNQWASDVTFWLAIGLAVLLYFAGREPRSIQVVQWLQLGWLLAALSATLWVLLEWPSGNQASAARIAWLNRQYTGGSLARWNAAEYAPDPYERLIRYFRLAGLYDDARIVASYRLTVERRFRTFFLWRPLLWLYEKCFDYGMSPRRALATFFALIALGWAGTNYAVHDFTRDGAVMVVSTATINSVATPDSRRNLSPAIPNAVGSAQTELACGNEIDPLLYAADLFVPVLNLNQKTQCSVSSGPWAWGWRLASALYTILGYLITSLTILTVSGILRRQVES